MKRVWFVLMPTLVLALLVGLGYWAGTYVSARRIANIADAFEKSESLAGVLSATPLSDRQRNDITKAYTKPDVDRSAISWAVPNQLTPFVGTAPRPGVHQNASINAWQMRSQNELSVPKPQGVYRMFLTGGSTAFGSGAPSQDQTVGALLEAKLNARGAGGGTPRRFEVFTFANPAWSTTQERIAIENYLSELEPDLIVSLSGNNDVFWGDAGRNVLWYSTFSDDYFNAVVNAALTTTGRKPPPPLPHAGAITGKVTPKLVATRLQKNATLGATALSHGGAKASWVYFLQPNLAASKKALSQREREFLTNSRDYYVQCYAEIAQTLRGLQLANFAFVDLSGLFDARGSGEEIFLDQFHFGDVGNEVIASAMAQEVARRLP
jgi:lysophospholipase L1-like esterase